jgi:hypothetical protein
MAIRVLIMATRVLIIVLKGTVSGRVHNWEWR